MSLEETRNGGPSWRSSAAAERAVLEQRVRLRKLLRMGMGQVQAAVMGAQTPIRSMVAAVEAEFARHLAEADALLPVREEEPPFGPVIVGRLQSEFANELLILETLGAWPEDEDDLELSLRFQELAPALLHAIASEERYLLETAGNDLVVGDPFGC